MCGCTHIYMNRGKEKELLNNGNSSCLLAEGIQVVFIFFFAALYIFPIFYSRHNFIIKRNNKKILYTH